MFKKYIYGGRVSDVASAGGVQGFLIRSGTELLFRVYRDDGSFTDYDIYHDDLSITIDSDALASFYSDGENHILDHSPDVFGLEKAKENDEEKKL
nr:hypothetical protein [Thiocapsa sp. KS1]